MIILGEGVSITPFGAIAEEVSVGRIKVRTLVPPAIVQRVGLAGRADADVDPTLAAVRAFLTHLARQHYGTLGGHHALVQTLA